VSDKDPRELWQDLVNLTDASDDEVIRSLRIALFILLWGKANDPFLRQFRKVLLSVRSLLPGRRISVAQAESRSVLFYFPHGTPSNMQNLLPVVREALGRSLPLGIVSAADYSKELAQFKGHVPIVTTDDLISQLGIRERFRIAVSAVRIYNRVARMIAGYNERLSGRLQRNSGTLLWEIMRSLQMAKAFPLLLNAWSPSCMVSTSDLWPVEYQLAHASSNRGICSIVIQHGNLIYYYWPFIASLYMLWGEESFEEMLSLGAPAERLAICGMPAADGIFNVSNVSKADNRNPGERAVCLILSQSSFRDLDPEMIDLFGRFISELIPATPWVRWKVKLHPSENGAFYDHLGPEVTRRLEFCPRSTTLQESLHGADVVTTLFSTAGLEAMLAGYPLIIPIVSPRMTEAGFPQIKGAAVVHTPAEFGRELKSLVSDSDHRARQIESQRKALNRSFAHQGHASEAIVDIIQSIGLVDVPEGALRSRRSGAPPITPN